MSTLVTLSTRERQRGGVRGGVDVTNVSNETINIQVCCKECKLDKHELSANETWLVPRVIRHGKWVFLLSSGSFEAKPLMLEMSSSSGISEVWQIKPDGPHYTLLQPDNVVESREGVIDGGGQEIEADDDLGEPAQPPPVFEEFIVTKEMETQIDDESVSADIELAWVDAVGKAQSIIIQGVALDSTLAEFRQSCASALGVASVKPQDFNEDMDGLSLNALGIGSSGLPFFVDLDPTGSSTAPEARDPSLPEASAIPQAAPCRRPAAASRPFAEKQALKDASEVMDGWLFLGGNLSSSNLVVLRELGVTHVLNCCERVPCKFKSSLAYKVLSVTDTKASDISVHFPEASEFVDAAYAAGTGILVHCMVGASRSTSIVLAWLVSRRKMPLLDAFRHVRARRSVARPNRSFCQQLIEFEKSTLGKQTATIADFGHK